MSYIDEVIQVAAVAVAMIEDYLYGVADAERQASDGDVDWDMTYQMERVTDIVQGERLRQDKKWGPQHHDSATWLAILMEEVGEAAQAYLEERL